MAARQLPALGVRLGRRASASLAASARSDRVSAAGRESGARRRAAHARLAHGATCGQVSDCACQFCIYTFIFHEFSMQCILMKPRSTHV